jgi:protein-disulfide isomerase
MTRKILSVVLMAGATLVGGCSGEPDGDGTSDLSRSLLAAPAGSSGDGLSTPIAADPSMGSMDGPRIAVSDVGINFGVVEAPVKVVEMSDYGCGYCRQFHQESFPTLLTEFMDTGMVEWKFVPYITGMFGNSLPATEAAECTYAQQESAFERLNNRLWNEQSAWKGSDEPAEVIRPWVEELDIDMDAFDSCMANDDRLERIAAATTLARQLRVRGTPTFVVLGFAPLQGALPLETFQELLTAVHTDITSRDSAGDQN